MNEEENKVNEIVEIDDEQTKGYDLENVPMEKEKKKKPKKDKGWNNLSKKQKTIILVSIFAILVLIIVILVILLFKDNIESDTPKEKEPNKDAIVINKDNYSYVDGKLEFKDINKATIGEYECTNKDDDLCYVANYANEDEFDTEKHVYENGLAVNNRSDIFQNRYVLIYDNPSTTEENIILYDIKEKKTLGNYILAKELNDNSVILKNKDGLYGTIKFGNEAVEGLAFNYSYLGYILNSDAIVVKENNNSYLIDLNGNKLSEEVPGSIKAFSSKFISSSVDGDIILYNYNAERVTSAVYDYLGFVDDYVVAIANRKLKVYDRNMNPLHYDELKLATNKYNTVVTFDENNREINREEAYHLATSNGVIEIDYQDNKKEQQRASINVYEGAISSKMAYVSYFDGKLYIFKDSEKQNLLGSYTCTNPNVVNENTTILENCFLALETNIASKSDVEAGYLPIYNKRYAFIQDGGIINFWDLIQNQKKATYKTVDAGFYQNDNIVNFKDTTDTIIVASNTSDLYGAIRINDKNLERVIDFSNKNIERINNQYLFLKDDNTYGLYNPKTGLTNNDITDFNGDYYVVKTSGGYQSVYTSTGKIVVTIDNLNYIKLYDKYFVGIDPSNRINIYNYSGQNISNSYNTVLITDYPNSYSIEESENMLKINILDSSKNIYSSFNVFL